MKNITVLSVLVIMLLFSAADTANCEEAAGKEKNYSFSFGPAAGFLYGRSFEYVYPTIEPAELYSELIWDIKPVFYLGGQFDFETAIFKNGIGFFASLGFKAGFPAESGYMEDRDWTSAYSPHLTNYSKSTNYTNELYFIDFSAGVSIPIKKSFYLKPMLAFSWMHFSFEGKNGYKTYESDNWEEIPLYGTLITYKQDWLLCGPGIAIGAYFGSFFHLEFSFKYTPFTYCAAVDHHFKTFTIYMDYSSWGHYFEPALNAAFYFSIIELSLEVSYRGITKTKGRSYANFNNTGYYLSPNEAGAALSLLDTRLTVKVKF